MAESEKKTFPFLLEGSKHYILALNLKKHLIQLPLCKDYEREMIQCPEAKSLPANSSQSSGFYWVWWQAPHVFSGPTDGGLRHITPQQGGEQHAVIALPA